MKKEDNDKKILVTNFFWTVVPLLAGGIYIIAKGFIVVGAVAIIIAMPFLLTIVHCYVKSISPKYREWVERMLQEAKDYDEYLDRERIGHAENEQE